MQASRQRGKLLNEPLPFRRRRVQRENSLISRAGFGRPPSPDQQVGTHRVVGAELLQSLVIQRSKLHECRICSVELGHRHDPVQTHDRIVADQEKVVVYLSDAIPRGRVGKT